MEDKTKPAAGQGDGLKDIEVVDFRPHESGQLRGFMTLIIPPLIVHGCKVFENDEGERHVLLPEREFTKPGGGTGHAPVVELLYRHQDRKFQVAALAALDRYLRESEDAPF